MPTYDAEKANELIADAMAYVGSRPWCDVHALADALLAATQEIERLTRERDEARAEWQGADGKADWYAKECERLRKLVASIESPVRYTLATLPIPGAPDVVTTEHRDWTAIHRGRATSAYRQLTSIIGPIAAAIRRDAGLEGNGNG